LLPNCGCVADRKSSRRAGNLPLRRGTFARWMSLAPRGYLDRVTPLNAIIGLTEMMVSNAARFGTEKALEPLRRVNAAGTHLLSLINEVLDLSKIEAGKLELNPEPVDLARLIDEVIGTAGQLAEKNQNRSGRRSFDNGSQESWRRTVSIAASCSIIGVCRCAGRVGMMATNDAIIRASSRSFLASVPLALANCRSLNGLSSTRAWTAVKQQRRDRLAERPGELTPAGGLALVLGALRMQRDNDRFVGRTDRVGHLCQRFTRGQQGRKKRKCRQGPFRSVSHWQSSPLRCRSASCGDNRNWRCRVARLEYLKFMTCVARPWRACSGISHTANH
jgi:His Kinase A (phospho-acceptor) domain